MPIVSPDEPYARLPHTLDPDVRSDWGGRLDVEDGVGVLQGVRISETLPLEDCRELHLIDCEVEGLSLSGHDELTLHIERCTLSTCDLSQIRLEEVLSSSITGSKLFGTDLAGAQLTDATIGNSTFRYLSLRMATLTRVAFVDDEMSEIDLYDSVLHDVSFDGCRLEHVSIDRCQLTRVDFREATRLGLVSTTTMKGSIISENQVLELAYQFAMASGVDIEPNEPLGDD